ncbi:hypothetical protein HNQ80_003256 [Anaerosolibacter carboniphilus]|uniref:Uncharacterized protein n=1 Tax=Anaerosolibacter carboniphilus TaxID=1417629 RepID=A0A841KYV4_9FIRM|nr:hypothetical protein [Anaerosolibacter carboniphilus]MBB6217150.1 hypothetical protein [Anaerosolibacter carboniphilus]
MKGKKIEVIVNKPNDEVVGKLMAKAWADIIESRINQLPQAQRLAAYDLIIEKLKKKGSHQ